MLDCVFYKIAIIAKDLQEYFDIQQIKNIFFFIFYKVNILDTQNNMSIISLHTLGYKLLIIKLGYKQVVFLLAERFNIRQFLQRHISQAYEL